MASHIPAIIDFLNGVGPDELVIKVKDAPLALEWFWGMSR